MSENPIGIFRKKFPTLCIKKIENFSIFFENRKIPPDPLYEKNFSIFEKIENEKNFFGRGPKFSTGDRNRRRKNRKNFSCAAARKNL